MVFVFTHEFGPCVLCTCVCLPRHTEQALVQTIGKGEEALQFHPLVMSLLFCLLDAAAFYSYFM